MAAFAAMVFSGPGIGCIAAGWIEQNRHLQWRWIQWIHVMFVQASLSVRRTGELKTEQLAGDLRRGDADMHEGDAVGRAPDAAREEAAQGDGEPALPCARGGRACELVDAHLHLLYAAHL